jgi:hypothetical protein
MTAKAGLLYHGSYCRLLFFPKSSTTSANSPLSSTGLSVASMSAASSVAPAADASPLQSASPVMHGPV